MRRRKVLQNWAAWRLVLSGFSYREVFYGMSAEEIAQAGCALDIQREADERALRQNR